MTLRFCHNLDKWPSAFVQHVKAFLLLVEEEDGFSEIVQIDSILSEAFTHAS